MLSWMFQQCYLDMCCFECLICLCFVFLYLHLFSAVEHVSHGTVLSKTLIIIIILIISGILFVGSLSAQQHTSVSLPLLLLLFRQTRPRFILSPERIFGNGVRTHFNFKVKIPSTRGSVEGRTRDAALHRTASSKCHRLSYASLLVYLLDGYLLEPSS